MKVKIYKSTAKGNVLAPPSKSMAHRALICAALSGGSEIFNVDFSKDIDATLDCLEKMGGKVNVDGDCVRVGGLDVFNIPDGTDLYCHESGSTLRFIIPLCMLSKGEVTIKGTPRLFARPLTVYEEIAREKGILFEKGEDFVKVGSGLSAGEYKVKGDVSSQFITGLLFALSCIKEKSRIEVVGKFESESYIDLTLDAMRSFGRNIVKNGRIFEILPDTDYEKTSYTVEGDYSNAAFLDGFNLLGGEVSVSGLKSTSLQGDAVYKEFYPRLEKGFDTFDLSDCPDLAPVLMALAGVKHGATFVGTKRLKIKESDRGEAMREELAKLGITARVSENEIEVLKGDITPPKTALSSHNDHRIAMALSLLLTRVGGEIEGAEAVSKSFPQFFKKLEELEISLEYYA